MPKLETVSNLRIADRDVSVFAGRGDHVAVPPNQSQEQWTLDTQFKARHLVPRQYDYAFAVDWSSADTHAVYIPMASSLTHIFINRVNTTDANFDGHYIPMIGMDSALIPLEPSRLQPGLNRLDLILVFDTHLSGIPRLYLGPQGRLSEVYEQQKSWVNTLIFWLAVLSALTALLAGLGLITRSSMSLYTVSLVITGATVLPYLTAWALSPTFTVKSQPALGFTSLIITAMACFFVFWRAGAIFPRKGSRLSLIHI